MVTSTGSGLAVPDWPLSYGMLFPPMVGGIFYEHGHRMAAAGVGFLTLCLTVWIGLREQRRWVRHLAVAALGAVVLQGILGGVTVLFFLPAPISMAHGVLAQTFFILTILIAYSQSLERKRRDDQSTAVHSGFLKMAFFFVILVYIQLILGAMMRHTGSGLAIPDFPKMGGYWFPPFDKGMLVHINAWRFDHDLPPVVTAQVVIHWIHRSGALVAALMFGLLTLTGLRWYAKGERILQTIIFLDFLVTAQLFLGACTVLTQKSPRITSLHVVLGAAILGVSVLLFLRAAPLSMKDLRGILLGEEVDR